MTEHVIQYHYNTIHNCSRMHFLRFSKSKKHDFLRFYAAFHTFSRTIQYAIYGRPMSVPTDCGRLTLSMGTD